MGNNTTIRVTTSKTKTENPPFGIKTSNDLIKKEPANFNKIMLMKSGCYWVAYDNSMWFLDKLYDIRNQERKSRPDKIFKRTVRWASLHEDDFPEKRNKLLGAGLELLCDTEKVLIFKMPKAVSKNQVKDWLMEETAIIEDVEAALLPDELKEQKAVRLLIDLKVHILRTIKTDMPLELRNSWGSELLSWASKILSDYMELEIGNHSKEEKQMLAREFIKNIQVLSVLLITSFNAKSMRSGRAISAGQPLEGVISIIHKKYPQDSKSTKKTGVK